MYLNEKLMPQFLHIADCIANRGLWESCHIALTLFKIYINKTLKQRMRKCTGNGIIVADITLNTLLFEDNHMIIISGLRSVLYDLKASRWLYSKGAYC